MTTTSLALLSNNLSTRNRADERWFEDVIADHRNICRYTIDAVDDIPRILADCSKQGVETLAVDGGDGTAGLVFSGLLNDGPYKTLPALALLPSGKTNMTAQAWSLRGNRKAALNQLIRRAADDELKHFTNTQAILAVRNGTDQAPLHGAFFGGADVVEGILYCRRAIYPLGLPNVLSHTAAVAVLFGRAMSSNPKGGLIDIRFDDSNDGEDGRLFVVLVTTMDRMLLGIEPDPVQGNGPVHYLSWRPGARTVLSTIPSLIRRRITPGTGRTVRRSNTVVVSYTGRYTLDGELYDTQADRPLTISGDQSLRFIRW